MRSLIRTISVGEPCLIIGEAGSGKTTLANRAIDELEDKSCCLAQYIGSSKQTLTRIAEGFHIPTSEPKYNSKGEETGERKLTAEDLRQEILDNARTSWILFCDDADLWPSSLRLWLCQLIAKGACVVLLSKVNLRKDIFLKAIAIELLPPTEEQLRLIMANEAVALNLPHSPRTLSQLQSRVGTNLALARKVVREASLGLNEEVVEHTQYLDVSPFLMAVLSGVAVVRFLGLGLGNRSLYLIGGISMCLVFMIRYFAQGVSQRREVRGR
ncbi:MAG: ATP-binding protein [Cyanobacteria bacterium J06592_8]